MKNIDLLILNGAIQTIIEQKAKLNSKLLVNLLRNKKDIADVIEAVKLLWEPAPEYVEYDRKRVALNEQYAVKDSENKPVVFNSHYVIDEKSGYETDMAALNDENAEVIATEEARRLSLNTLLLEDVDRELKTFSEDLLPTEISADILSALMILVE